LELSPFGAVRSAEILTLARAHPGFEVVHDGTAEWLFPLMLLVDVEALARDRPEIMERLHAAEAAARADPALHPTSAYLVLRRR
jgi:hypothetical protein